MSRNTTPAVPADVERLHAALRKFASGVDGPVLRGAYDRWAESNRKPPAELGVRYHGGWRRLLAAAGVRGRGCMPDPRGTRENVHFHLGQFREQFEQAALAQKGLGIDRFGEYRDKEPEAPSIKHVLRFFRTWDDAMRSVGSGAGRFGLEENPEAEIARAIRRVARESGRPAGVGCTVADYRAMRRPGEPGPTYIYEHCGSFTDAVRAAGLYPLHGTTTAKAA